MKKRLLFGLILALVLTGCVTTEEFSSSEMSQIKRTVRSLEEELKETQEENQALKTKLAELQKVIDAQGIILKMPTTKEIQSALKSAGLYQGKTDGQMGPQTKEAIKKFQQANGLNPDGVVGSRTWKILAQYLDMDLGYTPPEKVENKEE